MKHKAVRIDNLMYKGCEPHWKCKLCGDVVPFHCYTKAEFESRCCGCKSIRCDNCKQNEATFFYEENENGKVRSLHL